VLFLAKERVYDNFYSINVYPSADILMVDDGNFVTIKYTG